MGETPASEAQCMLISGTNPERQERERQLRMTGKALSLPALVDDQLREHAEVMRLATGKEGAKFTSLCLLN